MIAEEKKSFIPELIKGPERDITFSSNKDKITSFISPKSGIKGRLLSPEEGCGFSKVENKRIIGGSPAKNGIRTAYIYHLFNLSRATLCCGIF